jgi:hypothetical protein
MSFSDDKLNVAKWEAKVKTKTHMGSVGWVSSQWHELWKKTPAFRVSANRSAQARGVKL